MIEIARKDRGIRKDKLIILAIIVFNMAILVSLNIFLINKFFRIITTMQVL